MKKQLKSAVRTVRENAPMFIAGAAVAGGALMFYYHRDMTLFLTDKTVARMIEKGGYIDFVRNGEHLYLVSKKTIENISNK